MAQGRPPVTSRTIPVSLLVSYSAPRLKNHFKTESPECQKPLKDTRMVNENNTFIRNDRFAISWFIPVSLSGPPFPALLFNF